VSIKVRYHDFSTITRARTLPEPVDAGPVIARTAVALLDEVDPTPGVRLFGVAVSNLVEGATQQLSLLDTTSGDWDRATGAVDEVRARFGDSAVGPASLVRPEGMRVKRRGDTQWGPSG
jgi:DNA polymerase-4